MVVVKRFGTFEGKAVDQFTLTSDTGVEVDILSWGVTVRDWRVPVAGGMRSVVLGFDRFEDYPVHSPYMGSLAGRVANRIRDGQFELDGQSYELPLHETAPYMLHGGPEGIGRLVWDAEPDDAANCVDFTLVSPDGAMGFPGEVQFSATYRLTGNRLRLDLRATADRRTPISLVQHLYWNLGTTGDVLDHRYWFRAGGYTELDGALIPTGSIIEAPPGSERNFRTSKALRDAVGNGIEYDGNLVLDTDREVNEPVAVVDSPEGDLQLRLWTDRPGLQFYDAVTTDVAVPGLGGRSYGKFSGFCLEDQMFPDAVHHPHFPSIIHSPDRPYSHWCEIEIA